MGPCDSKHDPKGEVSNCECWPVSPTDWPAAQWENVTDLSNYAPRTDTIRAGCKQVSGPEYQYGHGTANSSMEARVGAHRLSVKYNRFPDGCEENKSFTFEECEADVAKAVKW